MEKMGQILNRIDHNQPQIDRQDSLSTVKRSTTATMRPGEERRKSLTEWEGRRAEEVARRNRPLPEKWMAALFVKFSVRYGHIWISAYSSDELRQMGMEEWGKVLRGLTGDDIKRGMNEWRGDMPPSAEAFRKACKPSTPECHRDYKRLPKPKRDKGKVAAAFAEMRGSIK